MYSIAPAAKLRHIPITCSEIFPINAPKNVPTPVAIPDIITQHITLIFFIPPLFIGTAIEIPLWYVMKAYCNGK